MFVVDEEECTGCGLCLESCPSGAIRMQGQAAEIIQGLCTSCGSCAEACPQNAIFEYEELPVPRGGARPPAESRMSGQPVVVGERRPALAREQKVAALRRYYFCLYRPACQVFAGRISTRRKRRARRFRQ